MVLELTQGGSQKCNVVSGLEWLCTLTRNVPRAPHALIRGRLQASTRSCLSNHRAGASHLWADATVHMFVRCGQKQQASKHPLTSL